MNRRAWYTVRWEAGLQRLRMQAGVLERRAKRGRGRRIEPQEGEDGGMRRSPTTWTPKRLRRRMGTRDHLEREGSVQKATAGGSGG